MTGPAETPDPRAPLDRLAAITANRIGCFEWDPAGGRFTLDDTGLAVFDLRPEEYEGTTASLNQRMPVEEVMRMHRLLEDIRAGRSESCSSYVRIRLRDGATRWTHVQGQAVHDPGLRVLGVVRDATTELAHSAMRLMAEDDRQRQQAALREMVAALGEALSVTDVVAVLTGDQSRRRLGARGSAWGWWTTGGCGWSARSGRCRSGPRRCAAPGSPTRGRSTTWCAPVSPRSTPPRRPSYASTRTWPSWWPRAPPPPRPSSPWSPRAARSARWP